MMVTLYYSTLAANCLPEQYRSHDSGEKKLSGGKGEAPERPDDI